VLGAPLAEAVRDLARRERADAIVVGQNLVATDDSASRLLANAPCVVLVAPAGHRFRRPSAGDDRNQHAPAA
jgi:nucleotide-binding universal stress UspA family protein